MLAVGARWQGFGRLPALTLSFGACKDRAQLDQFEGGITQTHATTLAHWLASRPNRLNPEFPPLIEVLYLDDCRAERIRAMRFSLLAGLTTGVLMLPLFWVLMPDIHRATLMLWLGLALPAAALCYLAALTRLPLPTLEWSIVAGNQTVCLCFSLLMAIGRFGDPTVYLGGTVVLLLLIAITGGLRFTPVLAGTACLCLQFGVTIAHLRGLNSMAGLTLVIMLLNTAAWAVFGNWRLETEIRRGYALALRERLARDRLARSNAELDDLAGRDALTNLPNRRTYDRWLVKYWSRAAATGAPIGLVVLDIDHFKSYNDYYGHAAGDACLQAVSACLRDQSRGMADHVARFGGEEFAVLLPGLSLEICGDVAERLRAAVASMELPHLGDRRGVVTVSCGAASLRAGACTSAASLFAAADAALYAAKEAGRNCVRLGEARHAGEAALG